MTKSVKKEKMVEVRQLVKTFNSGRSNEVVALRGVDLQILRGEMVAIVGASGSGKTTLLNCISGIDQATSGEVIVDGSDIQKMGDRKKTHYRARKMGFIFQTFNLIPVLTALENVEMPLLLSGVSQSETRARAIEMLEKVGLGKRLEHTPAQLSGGQQQRVTIARALVHQPAVIWADEPTGNLDRKTAFEVFDLMRDLNEQFEATFVVVTHDKEIADKTQRILHMESGEIVS